MGLQIMTKKNEHTELSNSLEILRVSEMHRHSGNQIYTHARKTFGLIYVLSGSAIYEFDGVLYPVKAGDLFCIPQKLPFSMRPIEKTYYTTRQFGLLIHDPELYVRMTTLYSPISVDSTLKSLLDYIFKFWNIPEKENNSLLEVFLRTILAQFYIDTLNYDNPSSAYVLTEHFSPATKKTLCYVESIQYKRFSLEQMARTLGYNKHYLCTAFAQDTGLTILKYVNLQKIIQALAHFFYWGTSLAEVCELLCFDNLSYFSKLFKSLVGTSPATFRKACMNLDAENRIKINSTTQLFAAQPMPMNDLFAGLQQLGKIVTR